MTTNVSFQATFFLLEAFERGLNLIGYVPVLGTLSGKYIRENYGMIETISGLALTVLATGLHLQQNPASNFYFNVGATFLGHGLLNFIRGQIEKCPFVPLFTALPYDVLTTAYYGRRFFSYI